MYALRMSDVNKEATYLLTIGELQLQPVSVTVSM